LWLPRHNNFTAQLLRIRLRAIDGDDIAVVMYDTHNLLLLKLAAMAAILVALVMLR
jgi:hypothetical protein